MNIVWNIVRKDLLRGMRDRSILLFGLVVPLALAFVLNAVLGGVTGDGSPLDGATFLVVDEDGGPVARSLTLDILPSVTGQLGIAIVEQPDQDRAAADVESGGAAAAIVIPRGFSEAATVSGVASLTVIRSADQGIAGDVAQAMTEQIATRFTGTQLAVAAALSTGASPARAGEIAAAAAEVVSPLQLVTTGVDNRELDSATYLSAGLLMFFLFFTVSFGVIGYLVEQEQGTLPRLLAGPVTKVQVIAGKVATSFIVGVVSAATFVVASSLLLGADFGPPLPVALLVVSGVASAVSLVAVVTSFARSAEQAGNLASIIAIVLGMIGGSFFPVATGPGLLSRLSTMTPHGRFLVGLGDLRAEGTVASVMPAVGGLLLFAGLLGGAGVLLARRAGDGS